MSLDTLVAPRILRIRANPYLDSLKWRGPAPARSAVVASRRALVHVLVATASRPAYRSGRFEAQLRGQDASMRLLAARDTHTSAEPRFGVEKRLARKRRSSFAGCVPHSTK